MADLQNRSPGLGADLAFDSADTCGCPRRCCHPGVALSRPDCGPGGSATCSASGGRKSSSQPHGILIADCRWLIGATLEPSPRGSCVLGVR